MRQLVLPFVVLPVAMQAQWTYVPSGTDAELRGLSAVNASTVWASGARGTVVRSLDGGRSWIADTIPGARALDLRALHAVNDGAGYVASAGEAEKGLATIYATGDGGRHWRRLYTTNQKGVFLDAIAFWDVRHGIALSDPVDGRFFVLITSDKGATWTRISPEALPEVLPGEAAFAASGSALVVHGSRDVWIGTGGGGRARVMRSNDRGRTWSVSETPMHAVGPASGIFSLAFFDAMRGVAVGGDYMKPNLAAQSVALTNDGGRTWSVAAAPPSAYLSGVAFAGSPRSLVAVGLSGTFVSHDGGQRWTHSDTVPLNSVRFAGRTGFAVGPRGRVARTDGVP